MDHVERWSFHEFSQYVWKYCFIAGLWSRSLQSRSVMTLSVDCSFKIWFINSGDDDQSTSEFWKNYQGVKSWSKYINIASKMNVLGKIRHDFAIWMFLNLLFLMRFITPRIQWNTVKRSEMLPSVWRCCRALKFKSAQLSNNNKRFWHLVPLMEVDTFGFWFSRLIFLPSPLDVFVRVCIDAPPVGSEHYWLDADEACVALDSCQVIIGYTSLHRLIFILPVTTRLQEEPSAGRGGGGGAEEAEEVRPPLLLLNEVQQPVTMWLQLLQGAVENCSALCWLTAHLNSTLQVNVLLIVAPYQ